MMINGSFRLPAECRPEYRGRTFADVARTREGLLYLAWLRSRGLGGELEAALDRFLDSAGMRARTQRVTFPWLEEIEDRVSKIENPSILDFESWLKLFEQEEPTMNKRLAEIRATVEGKEIQLADLHARWDRFKEEVEKFAREVGLEKPVRKPTVCRRASRRSKTTEERLRLSDRLGAALAAGKHTVAEIVKHSGATRQSVYTGLYAGVKSGKFVREKPGVYALSKRD